MIVNLTFNSDDRTLKVTKDGQSVNDISRISFFSTNQSQTNFSMDLTQVTKKEPDEDGFRDIDTITNITAETREALGKALTRYSPIK